MQTHPIDAPADGSALAVPPPQRIPGVACRAGTRRTHGQELPAHGRPPLRGGRGPGPWARRARCVRHERARGRVPEVRHAAHGARTGHGHTSVHRPLGSHRRDCRGDANASAARVHGSALRRSGPLAQEPCGNVRQSTADPPEGAAAARWVLLRRHRHGGGLGRRHARSHPGLPWGLRRKGRLATPLCAQHPAVPVLERPDPAGPVRRRPPAGREASRGRAPPSRSRRRLDTARRPPGRSVARPARSRDAPADGPPGSSGAGSGGDAA